MEINNLLDRCKAKLGAETDYQLWKLSGISQPRISDYRAEKRLPNIKDCFIIAEILEMDPKCLIAHYEGLAAKNEKTREFWKKKLAELGGIAASIFLVVTFIVTPTPAQAAPVLNPLLAHCILCKIAIVTVARSKQFLLSLVKQISGLGVAVTRIAQIPA